MYFKNEIMGFIQLGKALAKLPHKSDKGHKEHVVRQASPLGGSGPPAAQLTLKETNQRGTLGWSPVVSEFIFRLTTAPGRA